MDKSGKIYKTYVQTLKEELIHAMGCTEPIAIAYAAAKAREVLGCEPDLVKICVSNNIIKNVKSVVVPNTDGMKGIEAAAVAGILGGNATKELEVISEVTANQKAAMRRFLSNVPISVEAISSPCTAARILLSSASASTTPTLSTSRKMMRFCWTTRLGRPRPPAIRRRKAA